MSGLVILQIRRNWSVLVLVCILLVVVDRSFMGIENEPFIGLVRAHDVRHHVERVRNDIGSHDHRRVDVGLADHVEHGLEKVLGPKVDRVRQIRRPLCADRGRLAADIGGCEHGVTGRGSNGSLLFFCLI